MLNNLKAEYARKGIDPCKGVMNTINCSEKTARNKLNGVTPFTSKEGLKISEEDFNDEFPLNYLFQTFDETA